MDKKDEQIEFWDDYSGDFDTIYTHEKSEFHNFLDRVFRRDMYERFQFTLKQSKPISGKSILDVGCGPGHYSLAFASQGAKRVIGIDYSEKMIQLANESLHRENLQDNCQFLVKNIMDYDTDMKFDISIAIGLFDYVKDPSPIIDKMQGITTQTMIFSFPRLYTWRAPIRKMRLMMKNLGVYFYSKRRLESILESAGLNNYSIEKVGKLHCVTVCLNP